MVTIEIVPEYYQSTTPYVVLRVKQSEKKLVQVLISDIESALRKFRGGDADLCSPMVKPW